MKKPELKGPGKAMLIPGLLALLCLCGMARAQTTSQNYVVTNAPRISGVTNDSTLSAVTGINTKLQTTIQYVDGLGRPIQTLQKQASPLGYDMVMPQAYDQYGREVTKYLPYTPQTGTAGSYRPNAVISDQNTFYTSPPSGSNVAAIANPYAQTNFDNSPLNRNTEQGASGAAWQLSNSGITGSGHTMKMVYTVNTATTFATDSINGNSVLIFLAGINADMSRSLSANGSYIAGALTVTTMKDENWVSGRAGTMEEYKDVDGHVVCKRTYNYSGGTVQQLSTYYVYDDLGYLAYVIPPGANPESMVMTQATLDNLCYQYWYDERGRLFRKKLPGKGWEFTVYNTMDQVVMAQNAGQRNQTPQQFTFSKYDALGRVIMTGIYTSPGSNADNNVSAPNTAILTSLQNLYNTTTNPKWEAKSSANATGYDGLSDPTGTSFTYYTRNYFDDYTYAGLPANFTKPAGASAQTRGLPTASLTEVIGSTNMLTGESYYDSFARPQTVYSQHYLGATLSNNNYDAVASTYNFTNAPTTLTRKHYTTASTTTPLVTVYNKYIYDQAGRKLKTWEQLTNGSSSPTAMTLISNTQYNEVGQPYNKQLHSTDSVNYQQSIAYGYNERGWMLTSSAPLFAMQLYYNTGTNKQYNGNIAYQYWGTPGSLTYNYTYTYDKLNRLTSGASADGYKETGITYDAAGDITALSRYQANTLIDNLTYAYTNAGNPTYQVQTVADASGSNTGLVNGTTAYTFNVNGNLTAGTNTVNTGQNKSYVYNILNLPSVVTLPSSNSATFIYDANGRKLRKLDVIGGTNTTTDYISGIQYNNSITAIGYISTEEGQAVPNGTGFDYQYFLGDNLGNTRVTFGTKTGSAVQYQKDDYYPFGLEISRAAGSPKNEYLYNKKELQDEAGFGLYDYGARFYDPLIGKWTTVDPLAEISRRWSPYNYVENDPVRLTDPDGMMVGDYIDELLTSVGDQFMQESNKRVAEEKAKVPPKKKAKSSPPSAQADAAATASKVPKIMPKKGAPPMDPANQATISAPKEQINYNDFGLPSTSQAVGSNVLNTTTNIVAGDYVLGLFLIKNGSNFGARFIVDENGVANDLQPTFERIESGGSFPHANDGTVYENRNNNLPQQPKGYYREYVHPTPNLVGRAVVLRFVTGENGEMYFTPDHYETFIRVR